MSSRPAAISALAILLLAPGCWRAADSGRPASRPAAGTAPDAPSSAGATGSAEAASSSPTGLTLFHGARLVIGDGSSIEDGALLVEGDRILRVGRADEVAAPDGASASDLSGKTVIPALIDAHVHLGFADDQDWEGENYGRENIVEQLHLNARHGIGAVFSAGTDPNDFALGLQRDQRAGEFGGARFLFGAGMAPPGQGPNRRLLEELADVEEAEDEDAPIVRGAATPEEGREQVRDIAGKGIRFVKLWVDDRGGSQEKLSPEVYRAVTGEAHRLGLTVLVHHQSREDMKETARAGVDGYLHGRFGPGYAEDEELIRLLRESGAYVIPNLGIAEGGGPPPAERQREIRAAMTRFRDAGIPLVLGTDAGAIPGHPFGTAVHRELEIYVRSGLTPMEALVAGTRTAAEELGIEDMGTLEAGKSADFVVLDANPLEDIRNTRQISAVYLRGREVER